MTIQRNRVVRTILGHERHEVVTGRRNLTEKRIIRTLR
jgi:hypothetical protein